MKKIRTLTLLIMLIMNFTLAGSMKYPDLHKFVKKMKAGEHLNVVFLGGSITWGACASDQAKTSYRALVGEYLSNTYRDAHLKFYDAAIGGTMSKLGVFRMDRDVLPYKPDLVFVEFAVNDSNTDHNDYLDCMEGIVRKVKKQNPETVVFIVVLGAGKHENYGTIRKDEYVNLAEYYNLPYADVCSYVQNRIASKELDTDVILADGCHPSDTGYRIYADVIIENFRKAVKAKGKSKAYPVPLTANKYENSAMLELSTLDDLGDWVSGKVSNVGTWYDHQPSRWISSVITPKKAGAKLTFKLKCSGIGLYYEIYKEGKAIEVYVDGEKVYDTPTTMPFHYNRLGWQFDKSFNNSKVRQVTINAPEKNVKLAYILYTK